MTARRWISMVLVGTLLVALSPATTWAGPAQPQPAKAAASLHAAIAHAAVDAAGNPSLRLRIPAQASQSGARMQSTGGGGHVGMILGIVGSLAGVAATVYMVKQMQKTTKQITTQNQ
jgi:hypothetical protein